MAMGRTHFAGLQKDVDAGFWKVGGMSFLFFYSFITSFHLPSFFFNLSLSQFSAQERCEKLNNSNRSLLGRSSQGRRRDEDPGKCNGLRGCFERGGH